MNAVRFLAIFLLGMSSLSFAESGEYGLDKSHTRIFFDVTHRGFSHQLGHFKSFDGTFDYDPEKPAETKVEFTIDAASVDMFHAGLNEHLKNSDFFDVEEFPTLHFRSTEISGLGENEFSVRGDLTMLGKTLPVTFTMTRNKFSENDNGSSRAGFSGGGTLDRTLFGMDHNSTGLGVNIPFRLEIELVKTN